VDIFIQRTPGRCVEMPRKMSEDMLSVLQSMKERHAVDIAQARLQPWEQMQEDYG
jgi:hypothetical protein